MSKALGVVNTGQPFQVVFQITEVRGVMLPGSACFEPSQEDSSLSFDWRGSLRSPSVLLTNGGQCEYPSLLKLLSVKKPMVWGLGGTEEGWVDKLSLYTELVCLMQVSHVISFFLAWKSPANKQFLSECRRAE